MIWRPPKPRTMIYSLTHTYIWVYLWVLYIGMYQFLSCALLNRNTVTEYLNRSISQLTGYNSSDTDYRWNTLNWKMRVPLCWSLCEFYCQLCLNFLLCRNNFNSHWISSGARVESLFHSKTLNYIFMGEELRWVVFSAVRCLDYT